MPTLSPSEKSTNVRNQETHMKNPRPPEETGRVIALAAAFFGLLAMLGIVNGVFAKFSGSALAALAVFAVGYALATWWLDPEVRAWVRARLPGFPRKAPARSPGRIPAAPSSRRTSAPGSAAARAPAGD